MATDVQVHPYRWTEDDTGPPIDGQLGTVAVPVDITGHTFTLEITRPTTVLTKAGEIVGAAALGTFRFGGTADPDPWVTGDFVPGEKQICEVKVTDAASVLVSSEKFAINVDKKIS